MTGRHLTFSRGRGFTLVELVVVMSIIVLLAGAVLVQVTNRVKHGMRTRALQDITAFSTALDLYAADNGNTPTTEQGLAALITKPSSSPAPRNWSGPYIKKSSVPPDPWGNEYVYRSPGEENAYGYDLICYADDGQPGGESEWDADITNFDD